MKPWLATEGAVVLVDGTVIDWDQQEFIKLRKQVETSPHCERFKSISIDANVYKEFEGKFRVHITETGFGVKVYSSQGTFYSPIESEINM